MGEEAIESRHRVYKFDREHHARKKGRETNLHDIFIRAIQTSDPLISSISLTKRLKNKKPLCLPKVVKSFLAVYSGDRQISSDMESDEINELEELCLNVDNVDENLELDIDVDE